ncbi:methyl-accepting chemotaxis protein [Desulfitobacterium chlororespirans]|uniref:Methyl-accepting chemotaxis protein (MCP) signalling domain-containing protein n=1 Tax=Desulfitobacterium chlororespirans DSM 11544 TaxID=1121395 RepID=A0A1M7SJ00_9FIRM|nr:methyl-accepting chemotaxis protein [Desulfitobacterium chlororespirans]SHN58455.1 Methyl-accepting chemotaxis protein (MCP) signalling domain-containing protein [Desulfitobacterium chlororespirans DSM 11544]
MSDQNCDILECITRAAPFYQKVIPLDSVILVCDTKSITALAMGDKMRATGLSVGQSIEVLDGVSGVVRTGQPLLGEIVNETDTFGFPFKVCTIPIAGDRGQTVGAISFTSSMENQSALYDVAQSLSAVSQEISATSEELANSAQGLAHEIISIKAMSEKIVEQIKKTDEVLKFIKDVAANSNLLGLNAAIEAARAGEQGRGFAVVAEEIRKMATNSSSSINDINGIIMTIQNDFRELINRVNQVSELGESQAAASEQITASMSEMVASTDKVMRVAEIV